MKTYSCVIVDDDITSILVLEKFLSKNPYVNIKKTFTNSIEALSFINENDIDLVILDIEMPVLNGLEFINKLTKPVKIIIISSNKIYAYDVLDNTNISGYLHKPLENKKFNYYINKFVETQNSDHRKSLDNKQIFINSDRKIIKINIDDIYMIESKGDYIYVKTHSGNYIVRSTLVNILEKLPCAFIKVHKSYIVNISKITEINNNIIIVENEHVPISRTYSKTVKDKLTTI